MIKIILYMLLNISYNNAYIYPNKYILKQSYEIDFNLYKKDIEYIETNDLNNLLEYWNKNNIKYNSNDSYLIWKPKIKRYNIDKINTKIYPCFRETICIIIFEENNNNININFIIHTPFWDYNINNTEFTDETLILRSLTITILLLLRGIRSRNITIIK